MDFFAADFFAADFFAADFFAVVLFAFDFAVVLTAFFAVRFAAAFAGFASRLAGRSTAAGRSRRGSAARDGCSHSSTSCSRSPTSGSQRSPGTGGTARRAARLTGRPLIDSYS